MALLSAASDTVVSRIPFAVRLAAGVVLVNLFVVALVWLSLHQSRHHFEERVAIQSQNLSQALELTIAGIIDKVDVALYSVVDETEKRLASGTLDDSELNAYIARQLSRIPELDGIRIADAKGNIVYGTGLVPGSPAKVSDRDYFQYAQTNPHSALFIAKPVFGRVAKKWVVNLARRINRPDGSFAGVAWGSLSIDSLLKLFSSFDVGRQGSITLRDGNLAVIARYTEQQRSIGSVVGDRTISQALMERSKKEPAAGTYTAYASIDNIERTYSYRRISRYPLYIIVGTATREYRAVWWNDAAKILAILSLFMLGTLLSAWMIYLNWQGKREAQEELRRYHEHLEELIKERTAELEAFNYSVSHDLRRPLTNINSYCQVILEMWGDKLDGQCRDFVKGAYHETESMNQLIDSLLKFSRVTSKEMERMTIDLSEMVKEVAYGLTVAGTDRRVSFTIAEGVLVDGDPNLLRIVVENLLGNAWKFTDKQDEAVIEFGVKEIAGEPTCFFRDNGAGFDMADAAQLFVPFKRLPGTENYKGHGVGLATVERIIKRHGGKIWAEGEPGKGAIFYFTLSPQGAAKAGTGKRSRAALPAPGASA